MLRVTSGKMVNIIFLIVIHCFSDLNFYQLLFLGTYLTEFSFKFKKRRTIIKYQINSQVSWEMHCYSQSISKPIYSFISWYGHRLQPLLAGMGGEPQIIVARTKRKANSLSWFYGHLPSHTPTWFVYSSVDVT